MHRRDLLVGLALGTAAPAHALAGFIGPPPSRFRWTADGRVYRRTTAGWVDSIRLAPDIQVLAIDESGPEARLIARRNGHRFDLYSADGRCWSTGPSASLLSHHPAQGTRS